MQPQFGRTLAPGSAQDDADIGENAEIVLDPDLRLLALRLGADPPARPVAQHVLALIAQDLGVTHAAKKIPAGIVLPHMLETEMPAHVDRKSTTSELKSPMSKQYSVFCLQHN